jgi:hypothetical protein
MRSSGEIAKFGEGGMSWPFLSVELLHMLGPSPRLTMPFTYVAGLAPVAGGGLGELGSSENDEKAGMRALPGNGDLMAIIVALTR